MRNTHSKYTQRGYNYAICFMDMLMISEYYKLLQIKEISSQRKETKKLLGITNMRRRYKFLSSISQVCALLQCVNCV